uniref:Uncharacterized protein n=1 Tax=Rhizophora mucronata TaxID=61149 RepID=A0A2P2IK89_RHIMU
MGLESQSFRPKTYRIITLCSATGDIDLCVAFWASAVHFK